MILWADWGGSDLGQLSWSQRGSFMHLCLARGWTDGRVIKDGLTHGSGGWKTVGQVTRLPVSLIFQPANLAFSQGIRVPEQQVRTSIFQVSAFITCVRISLAKQITQSIQTTLQQGLPKDMERERDLNTRGTSLHCYPTERLWPLDLRSHR